MPESYFVEIRNNATGVVRKCEFDFAWDKEGSEFCWTEGNFSCDCNRAQFFAQANGEDDPNRHCGSTQYTAIKSVLPDGTEIPLDDD